MPVSIRISAVAGLAFILGSTAAQADWGCYDPEPGHPTAAERAAFIARLRPAAIAAETAMGVPASGLLAMAAQESGFGFTRTALNADNLFGWKYGQSARTAGLSSWRLECQPKSDPGKDYAVFSSFEDSLNFVARQLATASRYAPATAAARAARAAGESEDAVTERWLRAVQQAGYNPYESYTDGVMKTGRLAGVFDKPAPSPAASTQTTHAAPAEADVQKVLGWFKRDVHGRYMVAGAVCRPGVSKLSPGGRAGSKVAAAAGCVRSGRGDCCRSGA